MISDKRFPIILNLATGRDDKGQTENYCIYEGGGVIAIKNKRGENVNKNVILGGNGTIYVAKDLAAPHQAFVLLPKSVFDQMMGGAPGPVALKRANTSKHPFARKDK